MNSCQKCHSYAINTDPKGQLCDVHYMEWVKDIEIDSLKSELSLVRAHFCEVTGGHEWVPQETDAIMDMPWEECSLCGCGHTIPKEGRGDG